MMQILLFLIHININRYKNLQWKTKNEQHIKKYELK